MIPMVRWYRSLTQEEKDAFHKRRWEAINAKSLRLQRPGLFYCTDCKRYKLPERFYESQKSKNKIRAGYCKNCSRKRARAWALSHRDQDKARAARRRLANPLRERWCAIRSADIKRGLGVMPISDFIAWHNSQEKKCSYCSMTQDESMVNFSRSLCVDRMDNSKGYLIGNVTLACHRCNTIKSCYLTFDQMIIVAKMFFISPAESDPIQLWKPKVRGPGTTSI